MTKLRVISLYMLYQQVKYLCEITSMKGEEFETGYLDDTMTNLRKFTTILLTQPNTHYIKLTILKNSITQRYYSNDKNLQLGR